jgi:hypothetical protein
MMSQWQWEIDSWPGPDRKKWPGLRDIIQESPDGRYVAVLYSCGEIDIGKEAGFFALFGEPKHSPRLLLRPRGLTCHVTYRPEIDIQWIADRFCVVSPYGIRPGFSLSGRSTSFYGTLVFDVERCRAAYVPGASRDKVISAIPDHLNWKSWRRLAWWPKLWHG